MQGEDVCLLKDDEEGNKHESFNTAEHAEDRMKKTVCREEEEDAGCSGVVLRVRPRCFLFSQ